MMKLEGFIVRTSQQMIDLIVQLEGEILERYLDSKGIPTIGVGHRCDSLANGNAKIVTGIEDEKIQTITSEQSRRILRLDLIAVEEFLNRRKYTLTQYQFDALVSFIFNVGVGNFNKSSIRKYLDLGLPGEAGKYLSLWVKETRINPKTGEKELVPSKVLMRRRDAERAIYERGDYGDGKSN